MKNLINITTIIFVILDILLSIALMNTLHAYKKIKDRTEGLDFYTKEELQQQLNDANKTNAELEKGIVDMATATFLKIPPMDIYKGIADLKINGSVFIQVMNSSFHNATFNIYGQTNPHTGIYFIGSTYNTFMHDTINFNRDEAKNDSVFRMKLEPTE